MSHLGPVWIKLEAMIRCWSATSFLALVLLWCFTGTTVEAMLMPSGQQMDLPDTPYVHPYDPQRPPDPEPMKPSKPGTPYTHEHMFSPYVSINLPDSQNQNVPPPWPFPPPPSPAQNSQPPKKILSADQASPLMTGPFLPALESDQPQLKFTRQPTWNNLPQPYPVNSPSDHEAQGHTPTHYHYPAIESKPAPSFHQRMPHTYYEKVYMPPPSAGQDQQVPSGPSYPTRPVDKLSAVPSYSGLPVVPTYHLPNIPSIPKKEVDQPPMNPSLSLSPVIPGSHGLTNPHSSPQIQTGQMQPYLPPPQGHTSQPHHIKAGRSNHNQRNPPSGSQPWFKELIQEHSRNQHYRHRVQQQSHQDPAQRQPYRSPVPKKKFLSVLPVPNHPAFPNPNTGLYYDKAESAMPRGFSEGLHYLHLRQEQHTDKQTSIPFNPDMQQSNFETCDVPEIHRIQCGSPEMDAAACEAISCCYSGRQCYFGKSVTVQCTRDAQFIVVVARDATLPNIDMETISMLAGGPGCSQVDSNSAFSIYQFPVTACGSIVMEEGDKIIYENRMTSSYEVGMGPLGAITRDSTYDLLFQCRYSGLSVETLITGLIPLQDSPLAVAALGPIPVQLRLGNGQCQTKGCNEVQVAYSSYYTDTDYPVNKILRDNVFVEVRLVDRTDPNIGLTLNRCWTTTTPSPHSVPQWDILINGCPNVDDRYRSFLVPVGGVDFPSHYKRFLFKMFTFVDPNTLVPEGENVFIHCSTSICNAASGSSCEPMCYRKKRDVTSTELTKAVSKTVVSAGPLVMNVT
ncbi:uncharacterized protein LOC144215910 [Stigmatopora nigra]